MIVVLNRSVVIAEVIQWARYQVARALQCSYDQVKVDIQQEEKGRLKVSLGGPGVSEEKVQPDLRLIYRRMMLMAQERLEGLNIRRAK